MRGYAICAEPRSGSSYLGQILGSTKVLGWPREYFNAPSFRASKECPDYPEDGESQLALIMTRGATPNGVYGVKIFSSQFDAVKETRWAARLPSLSFIHLERRDRLGQALSLVRAMQTKQWTADAKALGEPAYNHVAIESCIAHLGRAEARWRSYFARNGAPVLHLVYEEIVNSPQAAAEAVGRLVGLTKTPRVDPQGLMRLRVQRDALTDEWRSRFLTEAKDLARFD
jgi:LPS sulfotransferase NodH